MLKEGQIIRTEQNGLCRVLFVNECRARVKPIKTAKVRFKTLTGQPVEFLSTSNAFDISPNSDVEIILDTDPKSIDRRP